MGLPFKDLAVSEPIDLASLSGKTIAIDAFNVLYQFLSSIRQADGTPLMDSKGHTTSHLKGLLTRVSTMVAAGVKPVFVFDGVPSILKAKTLADRNAIRDNASNAWKQAVEEGDMERARQMGQQSVRLTQHEITSAKALLTAMGIPVIDAPGEGEAQASHMCLRGDVWAAASQDYDALLFGTPRLVRNLTLSGRRKLPKSNTYVDVGINLLETEKILTSLSLTRAELVDACLMMGTDFNDGYKGIGPKTSVKLIKAHKTFEAAAAFKGLAVPGNLQELRDLFLKPNVTDTYKIEFRAPDLDRTIGLLVSQFEFNESAVWTAIKKMSGKEPDKVVIPGNQSALEAFEL